VVTSTVANVRRLNGEMPSRSANLLNGVLSKQWRRFNFGSCQDVRPAVYFVLVSKHPNTDYLYLLPRLNR
jgi:hypothetical protein